jgi:hypothetical protein
MKRYIVKLSEEEKKELHALTHKGTCGVRKLRRAQRCCFWPLHATLLKTRLPTRSGSFLRRLFAGRRGRVTRRKSQGPS